MKNEPVLLIFLFLSLLSWQVGFDQIFIKLLVWSLMFLCALADLFMNNWDIQLERFRLEKLFE